MNEFNAIDDPWIWVQFPDGTVREIGLRDALTDAHEIVGLSDPRPLGPPTQLRLLIAIVQRIFEPEDSADWRTLWTASHFDPSKIRAYFDTHQERFDLFHPQTPFFQVGGDFSMGNTNPIAKLAHELDPATYNTLFSHSDGPSVALSSAEAMRVLLLAQSCALGGGVSGNPIWNEKTVVRPNFSHAALATSAVVFFEGANLFETILLNLVPRFVDGDRPIWARDLDVGYFDGKKADGPLDRLTNLSRMIRLILEPDGTVARCYYTQGRALAEVAVDPMVSYRPDDKIGPQSRKISPDRASWRDLHGLLEIGSGGDLRAPILRFVGQRVSDGFLPHAIPLHVVGVAADKAKVLLWRDDRFSLPTAFLNSPERVVELAGRMQEASEMATEIGRRVRSMCWHYLAPVKDQMSPDTKDVNALADQLDARAQFWANLEAHYPELLAKIAALPDVEPDSVALVTAWWGALCAKYAGRSLLISQKRLGETPRAWRALAGVSTNFTDLSSGPKEKKEKK